MSADAKLVNLVWPKLGPTSRGLSLGAPLALCVVLLLSVAPASAQVSTQLSREPIINFRLPTFTPEGFRSWLIRGSEARLLSRSEIDVHELTMTVFTGNAQDRIQTMLLSPQARVFPEKQTVTGDSAIRVIDDEFEATGEVWRYEHREKKVSMAKNVRVTFRAELKNLLQ